MLLAYVKMDRTYSRTCSPSDLLSRGVIVHGNNLPREIWYTVHCSRIL
jgi:hypothetical protein